MAKAGRHERQQWTIVVLAVFLLTGYLFVAASITSGGSDLRPAGGDVASLLHERSQRVDQRRVEARNIRSDIDKLSASVSSVALNSFLSKVKKLEPSAGLTALKGPGLRVTLTDAPRTVDAHGVDPNLLVVHQQDIQAFVNALWAGGAEAVTLQGQRLISTTGIKCVGNTVVLDGVPYSPPYVIEAIGNTATMNLSVSTSPETVNYADYVGKFQLGLVVEAISKITAKAYAGAVSLRYAQVPN